jgi:transposase
MISPPDLSALSSSEKDALILALLARVDALVTEVEALRARVTELEAKLKEPPKTPGNSSTPPSQGRKASGETGSKPKNKPHKGAHRPLHPNPTNKCDVMASHCQHCGTDVSARPQVACAAYDHIEIPPLEPEVTRITLHGGICPCCAKKFKAAPPLDRQPGSPFGPNLRALVIYLRFTQGIGFERLAQLFSDILGLDISEGALVNMLEAAREPFALQTSLIRAKLLSGTTLCSDETGLRVGKKNWWLWVFHHEDNAVFVAAASRAKSVVEAFLGSFRPDFWVSDRYGGQFGWAQKENQICLAHLIRNAQFAIDDGDEIFAPGFRHLLGRACRIGRRRGDLADATLKTYAARLETKLDALMALTPTNAAGVKLQRGIKKVRRHLFVFITNRTIPPTNNGSERALRPCAVFRKITNGFRTEWGAKLYADIRSVIETARRRGIGALDAVRLTLARSPLQPVRLAGSE